MNRLIVYVLLLLPALAFGQEVQVSKYRTGEIAAKDMGVLALSVLAKGDQKLADSIARNYYFDYLNSQNDDGLLKKENIKFITSFQQFLGTSSGRYFKLFLAHPDIVIGYNNGIYPIYSRLLIWRIIREEEIDNRLYTNGKIIVKQPNWEAITKSITDKYGSAYAKDLVLPARIAFYRKSEDWSAYTNAINKTIKTNPPKINGGEFANATMVGNSFQRDDWNLNSAAWDVFGNCADRPTLKSALKWSNLSLSLIAPKDSTIIDQYLDTKANLLYKLGKVREAIFIEKMAYSLSKRNAEKNGQKDGGKIYLETVKRMEEGKPTWKVSN